MNEFILRARAAPAHPEQFAAAIGSGAGVEYLADIIRSALFVSQGHRPDTHIHLVLEKSSDFSRIVTVGGNDLGSVDDLHEAALLKLIESGLRAGAHLGKDESVQTASGLRVQATSFEHFVRDRAAAGPVFLLDRRGEDIRTAELAPDAVFVLTDHIPMPKKSFHSMARQGVKKLSIGPVMLHASQCISIIHNELDRRFT